MTNESSADVPKEDINQKLAPLASESAGVQTLPSSTTEILSRRIPIKFIVGISCLLVLLIGGAVAYAYHGELNQFSKKLWGITAIPAVATSTEPLSKPSGSFDAQQIATSTHVAPVGAVIGYIWELGSGSPPYQSVVLPDFYSYAKSSSKLSPEEASKITANSYDIYTFGANDFFFIKKRQLLKQ